MNCLNCERYLHEAIDSVYSQSYENWEIIFWDNGSCDNSQRIAKSYDSKLKYYKSEETTNLGKARVLAVEKANAEYLAFLDCDDIWHKDKLSKQMNIFIEDRANVGLVYGKCDVLYDGKSDKVINHNVLPEGYVFSKLVRENFITFVSAIITKKVYDASGGFPKDIRHSTDYWLFLNISKNYRVRAVQDICCTYRFHSENMTNNNRVLAAEEAIKIVSMFLPDKYAKEALKYHYDNLSIAYLKGFLIMNFLKNIIRYGGFIRLLLKGFNKFFRFLLARKKK